MSAIAGIFQFNNEPIHYDASEKIMNDLKKFPSDAVQTWSKDNIFFGCHAQWITPESITERLPFYDEQRRLAITSDAIIDNREELFENLQVIKNLRKTISDSELILMAYHKWGKESPKYLIGDFAFMIWDEKKNSLFGARDFSGARTLHFFTCENSFIFCTVIKPILTHHAVTRMLNEEWLAEYLTIPDMFNTINPFSTVYKNIQQIPPSHSISVENGKVTFLKYMTISQDTKLRFKSSEEYEEAFIDVFQKAVNARLRSHLQIGSQLSGGLDSGAVASCAARTLRTQNKPLHTFSYVPSPDFVEWMPSYRIADERPFITSTVNYVGNIKSNLLSFEGKSSFSEIDYFLDTLEMPYKFYENSFWIRGIYEEAKKNKVGVLLNGARGNQTVSWGPAIEYYASLLKRFNIYKLFREVNLYSRNLGVSRKRVLKIIGKNALPSFPGIKAREVEYLSFINPTFATKTDVFRKINDFGFDKLGRDIYEARKEHFKQVVFWENNGAMGTRFSLKYSLLERDPTNDLRVIKYCLSVPEDQYVKDGLDRALIRRSTKGLLPDEVRLNQKTRGFQTGEVINRMLPSWNSFITEVSNIICDKDFDEYIDTNQLKNSLDVIRENPKSNFVFNPHFSILMQSIITYRFLKKYI